MALLLATLLPGCLPESAPDTATTTGAATYTKHESRKCEVDLCILHFENDTDHDGIADDDELVAGTDPYDIASYPTIVDLASLIGRHALPSFEIGNSMLILLPTMDVNGLPVYGGAALLPSRKSSLERAGISVPSNIDIARGFTVTRTLGSTGLSFHDLFAAFDRGPNASIAGRLGDAVAWTGAGGKPLWDVKETPTVDDKTTGYSQGTISAESAYGHVSGDFSMKPNENQSHVRSEDGSFDQSIRETTDAAGNIHRSTVTVLTSVKETTLGGKFITTETSVEEVDISADKAHVVNTTTTTTTRTDPNGETRSTTTKKTTVCDKGKCAEIKEEDPKPAGETPKDGGTAPAFRDPEYTGTFGVAPHTMHAVLVALSANITVVQFDDGPLTNYEFSPLGIGNKYGPIALYGGDPENSDRFSLSPTFIHLPSATPDYDPYLQEGKPPHDAPPDQTCLYCFQP